MDFKNYDPSLKLTFQTTKFHLACRISGKDTQIREVYLPIDTPPAFALQHLIHETQQANITPKSGWFEKKLEVLTFARYRDPEQGIYRIRDVYQVENPHHYIFRLTGYYTTETINAKP